MGIYGRAATPPTSSPAPADSHHPGERLGGRPLSTRCHHQQPSTIGVPDKDIRHHNRGVQPEHPAGTRNHVARGCRVVKRPPRAGRGDGVWRVRRARHKGCGCRKRDRGRATWGFAGEPSGLRALTIERRNGAISDIHSLETTMPTRARLGRERPAQNATTEFRAPTGWSRPSPRGDDRSCGTVAACRRRAPSRGAARHHAVREQPHRMGPRRHCCVDRSKGAVRRLLASSVPSDRCGELIEGSRQAQTAAAGFDAEFVVTAPQVLDERMNSSKADLVRHLSIVKKQSSSSNTISSVPE
jgi:hypothetical protein